MSVKRSFNSVRLRKFVDQPGAGGETFLTRAIKMGEHKAIRDFLEVGADADAPNAQGELPLHIAMERDDMKALSILMGYGASIYRKQNGMTLREHALKLGNKKMADAARRAELKFEAMVQAMKYGF